MRRFLWLWLTLLGAFWATRTAIAALRLERVDLGFASLLALVSVPALQAAVVWWVTRAPGAPRLRDVLRAISTPWLWIFLEWDVLILALGWLLPENRFFTLLGGINLWGVHHVLLGLAAGAAVALSAVRGKWSPRERVWLGLFAAWLPIAGASFLVPWLTELAARLLPTVSAGLGWVAVAGPLFVLSTGLVLRIGLVWREGTQASSWLLDLAAATALASAAVAVLNLSLGADPLAPSSLFVRAGFGWALTMLFVAAFRAVVREPAP